MADKLLIRRFDVGLGDCIYCRIPKAHADGRELERSIPRVVQSGEVSSALLLPLALGGEVEAVVMLVRRHAEVFE